MVPAFGVPEIVAVPLSRSLKETPEGRAPDSDITIDEPLGLPDVWMVNVEATPWANVDESALVIVGGVSGSCTSTVLVVAGEVDEPSSTCQLIVLVGSVPPSVGSEPAKE